ncbi:MAG: tape measure protein [Spirochaetes bacterium]|nr:tape measure protein [Spirochaetota bacterium]
MPEFAVPTYFTVVDRLTPFFSKGEVAASKFETMVKGAFARTGHQASMFRSILGGVTFGNLAAGAIRRAGSEINELFQSSVAAASGIAALKTAYSSVFGTSAGVEMAFARNEANRLGMAIDQTAQSYMSIAAAAKGTSIAGATVQEIFMGVSEAATALKIPSEQASGALLAISQMISKGKVSAEELRGQLGERLPGAFQIAARAMDLTTGELDKMMSKGLLTADVFLPRFASQMRKEFGVGAAAAAQDFGAIQQRFENVQLSFRQGIGQTILPLLTRLYGAATPIIDKMSAWVAANQDLIATRIDTFFDRAGQFLTAIKPGLQFVLWAVQNLAGPVLAGVAAFTVLKYGLLAAAAAGKIFGLVNTILFAYQAYAGGAATAQEALNLVMAANPVGLIVAGISILVGLFVLLASKVGGVGPAFTVLGQTLMKGLLAPVNLIIDGLQFLFGLLSKIPGLGGLADIKAGIQSFQDSMNAALTGSEGAYNFAQPYKDARDKSLGREAPNQAQVDRQETSVSGRIDVYGPPQTRVSSPQGNTQSIRLAYMGANP